MARCDSSSRHTGGVLIYTKEYIKVNNIKTFIIDKSLWVLSLDVVINGSYYGIVGIYRSPSGSISEFIDVFFKWMDDYYESHSSCSIVIAGDFNIHYDKNCQGKSKLKEYIENNGMQQLVNEYTRIFKDSKSMIDLVISNDYTLTAHVEKNYIISDHCIVHVLNNKVTKSEVIETKQIRSKIIYHNMVNMLIEKDWAYSSVNIDEVTDTFVNNIVDVLNRVSPVKTVEVKNFGNKWFDNTCKLAVKNKNIAYKRFLFTNDCVDWNNYKIERNNCVRILKQVKIRFYESNIDRNRGNSKQMWKHLKQLVGTNKTISQFQSLEHEGVTYSVNLANILNQYYVDSIKDIIVSFDQNSDINLNLQTVVSSDVNFETFESISLNQLYDIIKFQYKKIVRMK